MRAGRLLQHQRGRGGRQDCRGDVADEDSLIQSLTRSETHELLDSGTLDGGMLPKIRSIAEALDAGVSEVVILNGTFPHSLLLEIFTDAGCGTMFTQDNA